MLVVLVFCGLEAVLVDACFEWFALFRIGYNNWFFKMPFLSRKIAYKAGLGSVGVRAIKTNGPC